MEDLFLSDALDGYDKVKGEHSEQIRAMQEIVSQRTRTKRNVLRSWSVAAGVLVVIGFGSYFLWKKDIFSTQPPEYLVADNMQSETKIQDKQVMEIETPLLADTKNSAEAISNTPSPVSLSPVSTIEAADYRVDLADLSEKKVIVESYLPEDTSKISMYSGNPLASTESSAAEEKPNLVDTNKSLSFTVSESELSEVVVAGKQVKTKPIPAVGKKEYQAYLKKSLVRPIDEACRNVKGKVVLSFFVDENGRPTGISVKKSLCPSADAEAVRLVQEGPGWMKGNQAVTLDVKF
jgi:cytoskeletal protein RodZ